MADANTPTDPKAGQSSSQTVQAILAGCNQSCPRCHAKITTDQLKRIFPSAPDDRILAVCQAFNQYMEPLEIIRCLRKAHLFAQIRGETGAGLNPANENLHYSKKRILQVFGQHAFTNHPGLEAAADSGSEQQIGSALYANRNGNGSVASGDGYNYRGRGYIQITGKAIYSGVQDTINAKCAGAGIDIVKNPDEASATPRGGMITAMAYWYWKKLNPKADMGDADATVNMITHLVRGGADKTIDAERVTAYHTTMQVFQTPQCVDRNKPSSAATPWIQNDGVSSGATVA